jgi:hypothetical protein
MMVERARLKGARSLKWLKAVSGCIRLYLAASGRIPAAFVRFTSGNGRF